MHACSFQAHNSKSNFMNYSAMPKIGRPSAVVKNYLRNNGEADEDGYVYCGAHGCNHKKNNSTFQATKWANQVVLSCPFTSTAVKRVVAAAHQTDEIKAKFRLDMDDSKEGDVGSSTGKRKITDVPDVPSNAASKARILERTDFCDGARAASITEAITQFIVSCALPFCIVNTIFFLNMITMLNAAYRQFLPKSDTFAWKWLPELFHNTVEKLGNMWRNLGDPLLTLGFDAFKTEAGSHVINITETSGDKTAFKSCVDPGSNCENADYYANLINDELIAGAESRNKTVEDAYAGVV